MKIRGEIGLEDRPLQSEDSNEKRGFEFSEFLANYGYKEKQHHLAKAADAVRLLSAETSEGRHPLISDLSGSEAHILAAFENGAADSSG